MAKYNNRYIQFYTPGTAAVKVEIQKEQNWAPLPELRPEERKAIYIDPVAILGCIVAVCMLILMAAGIHQINNSRREVAALERYVAQLTAENQVLEETYASGYNLSDIRRKAQDMGMVPAENIAETPIFVKVELPEEPETVTAWQQFTAFLIGLFA